MSANNFISFPSLFLGTGVLEVVALDGGTCELEAGVPTLNLFLVIFLLVHQV